jgi:hypothetical protein
MYPNAPYFIILLRLMSENFTLQRETSIYFLYTTYFVLVSAPLDEDEAEKQRRTIVAKYDRVRICVVHLYSIVCQHCSSQSMVHLCV